jgi:hypothetical protein
MVPISSACGLNIQEDCRGLLSSDFYMLEEKERRKRASEEARKRLNMGRCCSTCRYRVAKNGHFVTCKRRNLSIWDKAVCSNWRHTRNLKRLVQFDKYIEERNLVEYWITTRQIYQGYPKLVGEPKFSLGRTCFTCKHRGLRKGHFLECKRHERSAWDKALCQGWSLTGDPNRLCQFKKYMNQSGLETKGMWWNPGKL